MLSRHFFFDSHKIPELNLISFPLSLLIISFLLFLPTAFFTAFPKIEVDRLSFYYEKKNHFFHYLFYLFHSITSFQMSTKMCQVTLFSSFGIVHKLILDFCPHQKSNSRLDGIRPENKHLINL